MRSALDIEHTKTPDNDADDSMELSIHPANIEVKPHTHLSHSVKPHTQSRWNSNDFPEPDGNTARIKLR